MKTMKIWRIAFAMLAAFSLASCSRDDDDKDITKEIIMNVSAEPGVMYDLFDSMGEHPIECMQVMTEDEPGQWQYLYFSEVKGFTYERGHEYVLRVKRTILANPPQDASDRTYELVRILADKKVEDMAEPVDKMVKSEADIEYEQQCPIEKYAIAKGGEYLVDADGTMTYADGTRLPNLTSMHKSTWRTFSTRAIRSGSQVLVIWQHTPTFFHRLPMRYALCRAHILPSSSRTYLPRARWHTSSSQ